MMVMEKNGTIGRIAGAAVAGASILAIVIGGAIGWTHQISEINARLDRNLTEIKQNRGENAAEHAKICLAHRQLDIDLRLHIVAEGEKIPPIRVPQADC